MFANTFVDAMGAFGMSQLRRRPPRGEATANNIALTVYERFANQARAHG